MRFGCCADAAPAISGYAHGPWKFHIRDNPLWLTPASMIHSGRRWERPDIQLPSAARHTLGERLNALGSNHPHSAN